MLKRILYTLVTATIALATASAQNPHATTHDGELLASANFMNTDLAHPFENALLNDDTDLNAFVNDLLGEATSHIGTRYRRGGKTPAGFDCSGFTGYVFKQFGIDLSASSRSQFNDGIAVSTDEVKPGDLLFFKGSRSNTIGHVGIAIESDTATGEISFIHSATGGGIRIDRISAPYYSKRYVGARRVIL